MNAMAEDKRNTSDIMMIKTVDGKDCEKYRTIMDDCKSECGDQNKTSPEKSITPDLGGEPSSKGQSVKPPFVEVSLEIDDIQSNIGPEEVKQRSFAGNQKKQKSPNPHSMPQSFIKNFLLKGEENGKKRICSIFVGAHYDLIFSTDNFLKEYRLHLIF